MILIKPYYIVVQRYIEPLEAPDRYEPVEIPDYLRIAAFNQDPAALQAIRNMEAAHRAAYDAEVRAYQAQFSGQGGVATVPVVATVPASAPTSGTVPASVPTPASAVVSVSASKSVPTSASATSAPATPAPATPAPATPAPAKPVLAKSAPAKPAPSTVSVAAPASSAPSVPATASTTVSTTAPTAPASSPVSASAAGSASLPAPAPSAVQVQPAVLMPAPAPIRTAQFPTGVYFEPLEVPDAYEPAEIPDYLRIAAFNNDPAALQTIQRLEAANRAAYDAEVAAYRAQFQQPTHGGAKTGASASNSAPTLVVPAPNPASSFPTSATPPMPRAVIIPAPSRSGNGHHRSRTHHHIVR